MCVTLKELLLVSFVCSYWYTCAYPHALLLLNIKNQKPSIMPSQDLPDSERTAPSVRSTRGRAAKREAELTGQFVCTSVHII